MQKSMPASSQNAKTCCRAGRLSTLTFAVLACGIFAPGGRVFAELVRLRTGMILEVAALSPDHGQIRLSLPSGGVLVLPSTQVVEVLAQDTTTSRQRTGQPEVVPHAPRLDLDNPLDTLEFDVSQALPALPYGFDILNVSQEYAINPMLVAAIISAESGFDPQHTAVNGGKGLMGVRPEMVQEASLPAEVLFQPKENVVAGARFLRQLIDQYSDLPTILANYKAGGTVASKWRNGLPDDPELLRFIERVYVDLHRIVEQASDPEPTGLG